MRQSFLIFFFPVFFFPAVGFCGTIENQREGCQYALSLAFGHRDRGDSPQEAVEDMLILSNNMVKDNKNNKHINAEGFRITRKMANKAVNLVYYSSGFRLENYASAMQNGLVENICWYADQYYK